MTEKNPPALPKSEMQLLFLPLLTIFKRILIPFSKWKGPIISRIHLPSCITIYLSLPQCPHLLFYFLYMHTLFVCVYLWLYLSFLASIHRSLYSHCALVSQKLLRVEFGGFSFLCSINVYSLVIHLDFFLMKIWRIFGFGIVKSMAEGTNIADEEEEGFDEHAARPGQHHGFDLNFSNSDWITLGISAPKRIRMSENGDRSDQSGSYPSGAGSADGLSSEKTQDADYSCISSLSYELESLIFARFPRSEHWKLCSVNKRCLTLSKSGELYKIRREIGFKEPSVFMSATGQSTWWEFDREFKSRRKLPVLPSDHCFVNGDKESLCAGTHLLVSGKEIDGLVVWRYELAKNKWYKGPSMITPRCLFASATCGSCAYVAGGMAAGLNPEVYDTAEKYNPDSGSWEPLPRMKRRRKLCAGCYMDNKFYVIGGRNGDGELTCGEFFDETKNRWELIPDMLKDDPVQSSHSPPLLAIVNNELYSLEASSNQLKMYLKKTNTWKQLGTVPVRADCHKGWGVAFKSLGNELLVIGASSASCANHMAIFTCCPDSDSSELMWRPLDSGRNCLSLFILNCCVMVA